MALPRPSVATPMIEIDLQRVVKLLQHSEKLADPNRKPGNIRGCKTFYESLMRDNDHQSAILDFYFSLSRHVSKDFMFVLDGKESEHWKLYYAPLRSCNASTFDDQISCLGLQDAYRGDVIVACSSDFGSDDYCKPQRLGDKLHVWTIEEFFDKFIISEFFDENDAGQAERKQAVRDLSDVLTSYLPLRTWSNQMTMASGTPLMVKQWLEDDALIDKILIPFTLPTMNLQDTVYAHSNYVWPYVFNTGSASKNGKEAWLRRMSESEGANYDSVYSFLADKLEAVSPSAYKNIMIHDSVLKLVLRSDISNVQPDNSFSVAASFTVSTIRLFRVHKQDNLLKAQLQARAEELINLEKKNKRRRLNTE